MKIINILFIFLIGFLPILNTSQKQATDSISYWMRLSKDKSITNVKKLKYLNKAYSATKQTTMDSAALKTLSEIAYRTYKLKDTLEFKKRNNEILQLAIKYKNQYIEADANWNLGIYYRKAQIYDSTYFYYHKANIFFSQHKKYLFEEAKTLDGMAFAQGRYKNYAQSEVLLIKAITIFKQLKDDINTYRAYNSLAGIQKDNKEYERALFYYDKALLHAKKHNNYDLERFAIIYHNIANTHLENKNYPIALTYYNKSLEQKDLPIKKPLRYAKRIANKSHCKILMKDTLGVYNTLKHSLIIRDSLGDKEGMFLSNLFLSDYYRYKKDTLQAINSAKTAYKVAKTLKNGDFYLRSLLALSKTDKTNTAYYLNLYIKLNDSLEMLQRRTQNKFSRIAFETDEYIEETKRLSQQKIWIIIVSLGLVLISILLFLVKRKDYRNKELSLVNEQQKTNEQVYLLTLQQQENIQIERVNERNRISKELHDGILGKLFGLRVGLGFLQTEEKSQESFKTYLDELQTIEKEIRNVSHKLAQNISDTNVSFTTLIKELLEKNKAIGNFTYAFNYDQQIEWGELSQVIKVNLYRIIQESIQNIIKHAEATEVVINFSITKKLLKLEVKDNGKGFITSSKKRGIGLKNIKSRVTDLQGVLKLVSSKNKGTIIEVILPIENLLNESN